MALKMQILDRFRTATPPTSSPKPYTFNPALARVGQQPYIHIFTYNYKIQSTHFANLKKSKQRNKTFKI